MKSSTAPIYLSAGDLDGLGLSTRDTTAAIEQVLLAHARGAAWNAPKAVITPPNNDRYMMSTPSAADDPPYLASKCLIVNPHNSARGVADINALVTLLDSDTGVPVAILDGNWVTAVRTAGLSAVVATRLAKPDASSVAFIGCGVQAHSHLRAFADLFPIRTIFAFDRGTPNRERLCATARSLGMAAHASTSAREAVGAADIVVSCATLSPQLEPFLDARWLKRGAYAAITDLATPWIAAGIGAFDRIVVDDVEQERAMAQPLVDPDLVSGDITGLVSGGIAGRATDVERTALIFRGLALGDLAVAALAFQRAA